MNNILVGRFAVDREFEYSPEEVLGLPWGTVETSWGGLWTPGGSFLTPWGGQGKCHELCKNTCFNF